MFSKSGTIKIWVIALLAIIIVGIVIGAYGLSRLPSPSSTSSPSSTIIASPTNGPRSTPFQTPNSTPSAGQFINVSGYAQYGLSQTEFVFVTATKTYNVTMDLSTQAVNLNGKLLGGYQIVSVLIPLQLTVRGTLDGSTIMAQTVIIPTTKDKLT